MSGRELHKSDLGAIDPLASGGTARVFRVQRQDFDEPYAVVYKEYKESTRRRAQQALLPGLWSIVGVRDRLQPAQRRFFDERAVWPLRIVVDDSGAALGILMRLIPDEFFQRLQLPSGSAQLKPREAQFLFYGPEDAARRGMPLASAHDRIAILAQVARAFGLLHRADVVFGDLSGRNVVYYLAPNGDAQVLLVDCDSVRVKGTRSPFGAQPHTPRWEPPECLDAQQKLNRARRATDAPASVIADFRNKANVQSKATDVYKYGLLVVRVLQFGRDLSANRNPAYATKVLKANVGAEAADLLLASLSPSPADRPSMRQWYEGVVGRPAAPDPPPVPTVARTSGNWTLVEGVGWQRIRK